MASANLMGLVRELKALNARKKAGESLSDDEKKRRKELKVYLKAAMEQQASATPAAETTDTASLSPSAVQPSSAEATPARSAPPSPVTSTAKPSPVTSAATASPAPRKGNPNAFAIDASALIGEAVASDAINTPSAPPKAQPQSSRRDEGTVDLSAPLAGFAPQGRASSAQIDEMVAKSDAATRANSTRERATVPDDVEAQLAELRQENAFTTTSNEETYLLDDYFGGWEDDGYAYIEDEGTVDIAPIDPREMELHKVGLGGGNDTGEVNAGDITIAAPPGLVFADDFVELYASGVLPKPEDDEEPDLDDPDLLIPGRRKVTVHMLNGASKRGVIRTMRKGDLGFVLEPLGSGTSEELSVSQIKAVFIQRSNKAEAPAQVGQAVTVTFRDQRKVQGLTTDYAPGAPMFTLTPKKGQFERIIVNGAAVSSIG